MRGVFLWHSVCLSGALVFVIHSVGVLDAAPVIVAQGSLYGEESALHYQATSFLLCFALISQVHSVVKGMW